MRRDDTIVYKIGERVYRISPSFFHTAQKHYNRLFPGENEQKRDPNVVPKLTRMAIEVSIICNLRCPFCWWWGEKGIAFDLVKTQDPMVSKQLTTQEIKGLVDQGKSMGMKELYLSGGEPFIRPDTTEIIKYAAANGMFVSLTTNGTLIKDEQLRELSQIRQLSMTFSIDGTREIHDKIRGAGMYDKTIDTIKRLKEYKGKNRYPAIRTNTTFSPWLMGHTVELAKVLGDMEITAMHFQHLWFTDKQHAETHKKFLKANFGFDDKGVDSHILTMPTQMYAEQLADEVKELERTRLKTVAFVKPQMTKEQMVQFYTNLNFSLRHHCTAPWDYVSIKANGDLVYCPDEWVTYSVGNVRKSTLEQLWYGENSKKFREVLSKGLFPACARCCTIN